MFGGVPVASLLMAHGVVSVGMLYKMNRMITEVLSKRWSKHVRRNASVARTQAGPLIVFYETFKDIWVVFDHCDGILKANLFRHRCLVDWAPLSPSQ